MLVSFIFSYSEIFVVVFYLSFYLVLGQDPSARDTNRGCAPEVPEKCSLKHRVSCTPCRVAMGPLSADSCGKNRFLLCPHLCLFLVFTKENLDDFFQCKMKST